MVVCSHVVGNARAADVKACVRVCVRTHLRGTRLALVGSFDGPRDRGSSSEELVWHTGQEAMACAKPSSGQAWGPSLDLHLWLVLIGRS